MSDEANSGDESEEEDFEKLILTMQSVVGSSGMIILK